MDAKTPSGLIVQSNLRVIDGDTISCIIIPMPGYQMNDVRIRLAEINCPERRTPRGIAASEFTRMWLADKFAQSQRVWFCHGDEQWLKYWKLADDDFGRQVGYITADGTDKTLQEELLRAGLAEPA